MRLIATLLMVWILLGSISVVEAESNASNVSAQIDKILLDKAQAHALTAAPLCNDEAFLRRLTLDLQGRIPTPAERSEFLKHPDRETLIARLVESEQFSQMWADLWTTQLYGYVDANETDREALSMWLFEQVHKREPLDRIAYQLIASTGDSAFDGHVNFILRYPDEPVVKISRAFLGVRLDCARCHDHPFDRWTEDDYQRMSRFFEPMVREDLSQGNVRLSDGVPGADPEQLPRFLTGAKPRTSQWRQEFALFTIKSRPFARNIANQLWYHLMGRGIVHPVDDVNRDNPPAIPELLELLADEVIRSGYDLRHMLKTICGTEAYQRQSVSSSQDENLRRLFLVRTIKPLPPEHLYAATSIALDRQVRSEERLDFIQNFIGESLDTDFSSTWEYRETIQGFMARLVASATPPTSSIDELFVRFLGRLPSEDDKQLCANLSPSEISYLLLHSSEFAFNH